jgi:hypothetical protein
MKKTWKRKSPAVKLILAGVNLMSIHPKRSEERKNSHSDKRERGKMMF